jgi:ribosomal protein S18 acetylase RimI-like enzyme
MVTTMEQNGNTQCQIGSEACLSDLAGHLLLAAVCPCCRWATRLPLAELLARHAASTRLAAIERGLTCHYCGNAHGNRILVTTVTELTVAAYAPYTAMLNAPPLPVTDDYGPRIAAGQVWLLEVAGEVVGLLVIELLADHAMIFSVAVSPRAQGKGYGIRLLQWADRQAAEAGLGQIRLYTNARMERNIALYAAYGYAETGRRPNPYRPGWVLVDMVKKLDAA